MIALEKENFDFCVFSLYPAVLLNAFYTNRFLVEMLGFLEMKSVNNNFKTSRTMLRIFVISGILPGL